MMQPSPSPLSTERRRIILMRHGAVEYFDATGRPYPPDAVPLTERGIQQARAAGQALVAARIRIDRVISSGLERTRSTATHVLEAMQATPPLAVWSEWEEIRGGRLASIPDEDVRQAFLAAFEGPVPRSTRFLNGETIGELLDRVHVALPRLLAATDWDTALLVLHGGVNRALLSWFLTGEPVFLGGLAQDPGCVNIIDVGASSRESIVRLVNYCALDPLQTTSRLSTMEHLLGQYMKLRERRTGGSA
jgi:broad specificity phosphatase PhoE